MVQQRDTTRSRPRPPSNGASLAAHNSRPTMMAVEHATKRYQTGSGSVHALEDLSLEIAAGEFVCILGPSGCGKSTLLWAMSGLHDLTGGTITLAGTPVQGPRPEIGMIFQEANLLPWRNLWQNIHFPFEIKKLDPKPHQGRIRKLLADVGLTGFETKMPRELSGGMQQRASIVRCLSFDPSVILMDEPFGALDAFTRDEMNLLVQRIWTETGKTVVFITHSIPEAVFLGDRVYVMSARPGRLARVLDVDMPRPRPLAVQQERGFVELVGAIKATIDHRGVAAAPARAAGPPPTASSRTRSRASGARKGPRRSTCRTGRAWPQHRR